MRTTATRIAASGAVVAGLVAGSTAYSRWCRETEETEPGATSLRVAAGTGYTLLAATVLVGLWRGWSDALRFAGCVGVCFAAAGAPMIAGDVAKDS